MTADIRFSEMQMDSKLWELSLKDQQRKMLIMTKFMLRFMQNRLTLLVHTILAILEV